MSAPQENRHWVLGQRPVGNNYASAFALRTQAIPVPGNRQLLVENKVLSMDSGTRMYMTDREDSYQP
ncbi:MAG: NADP-dependent oxidoreductase, partial [Caulobacterales bacterium]